MDRKPFKMKPATIFNPCSYAITVLLVTLISYTHGQTMVSVAITSDGEDGPDLVKGGDTITFLCNIIGFQDGSIVNIIRTLDGNSEILYSSERQSGDIPSNVEFRGFTESEPGSRIYMVMLHNVTKYDIGRYSCVVLDAITFAQADDTLDLNIRYLPSAIYPICDIVGDNNGLARYEDEQVTMRCETEVGNPEVYLDWTLSGRRISANDNIQDGLKFIEIVVNLQLNHDGKTFDCTMLAGLDHNYTPKCSIGPFHVQSRQPTTKLPTISPSASTHRVTTALLPNVSPEFSTKRPISLDWTTKSNQASTLSVTMVSDHNRSETTSHKIDTSSRLSRVNIALICIFVILLMWVAIVFACMYIRKNKATVWAPPDFKFDAGERSDSNANLTNFRVPSISSESAFIINDETEDTFM